MSGWRSAGSRARLAPRVVALSVMAVLLLPAADARAQAPPEFHAQWLDQTAYLTLSPGETASYTMRFRNTGSATWTRGARDSQVTLGIANNSRAYSNAGMAAGWLSPDRLATTAEGTVPPGAVGTFSFSVRAPAATGSYRVPVRLVVDGVGWLDDTGVYFVVVSDHGFAARWSAQSPYPSVSRGAVTSPISIRFRNTGRRSFVRGTPGQQLNLGVALDDTGWGRYGVGWLSPNRVATTTEATVPPGGVATFTLSLRAPTTPGTHVLRLRPVVDGVTWLEDQGVYVAVTVLEDDVPAVLVGAGDIATCEGHDDEATSAILDGIPGTVFTLGDNAYERGTADEFANCYRPSWGGHRERTRPAIGNHEYWSAAASGHFSYFGAAAGDGNANYSFDAGAWHVVVLNSNCEFIGGCHAGSAQEQWLRADLAAHPARCTLAYWHEPLFTSSLTHAPRLDVRPLWRTLQEFGADLVLTAHHHHYERFAPLDADGVRDDARGMRSFIVGTGGAPLRHAGGRAVGSEVVRDDTHGVLKLLLYADRYEWEFVPVAGKTFRDSGGASCH